MSTEKSDPAGWDGESRFFATLGKICCLLHMWIPPKKQSIRAGGGGICADVSIN